MMRLLPLVLLAGCSLYTPGGDAGVEPDPRAAEAQKLRSLAAAYQAWEEEVLRTPATDAKPSEETAAARVDGLKRYLARIQAIDPDLLDEADRVQRHGLENRVREALVDLERPAR
jgi:hypothetical protein